MDIGSGKEYFCVRECVFNKNYWEENRFYKESDFGSGLLKLDPVQPTPKYMIPVSGKITAEQRKLLDTKINELNGEKIKLEQAKQQGHVRGVESAIKGIDELLNRLVQIGKEVEKPIAEPVQK